MGWRKGGRYVGACAFKSATTEIGVEIAYFTFPEFECKGIATQMARELVAIAESAGVKVSGHRRYQKSTPPPEFSKSSVFREPAA